MTSFFFLNNNYVYVILRYGVHLKLLSASGEAVEKLTLLIKQVSYYLKQQQRAAQGTTLRILSGHIKKRSAIYPQKKCINDYSRIHGLRFIPSYSPMGIHFLEYRL